MAEFWNVKQGRLSREYYFSLSTVWIYISRSRSPFAGSELQYQRFIGELFPGERESATVYARKMELTGEGADLAEMENILVNETKTHLMIP